MPRQSYLRRRPSLVPGSLPARTATCSFAARSTSWVRSWPCASDGRDGLSIAPEGANMQHVNGQRVFRSSNPILGGVCAGPAEEVPIDALWVRVPFLFLGLLP